MVTDLIFFQKFIGNKMKREKIEGIKISGIKLFSSLVWMSYDQGEWKWRENCEITYSSVTVINFYGDDALEE